MVPVNGTRKRLTVARPRVIRQNVVGCKTVSLAEEVLYKKPNGVPVKLSAWTSVWRETDIDAFCDQNQGEAKPLESAKG